MSKILFISDYAPTESNSGGVVMAEQLLLLSKYAEVDVLVYSSDDREYQALISKSGIILLRPKFGERQLNIKKQWIKKIIEILFNFTILNFWLVIEKQKLKKILKKGNYSRIMFTVQGLYLARLFSKIELKANTVILQYWDPDIWWAQQHNFTISATKKISLIHRSMEESKSVRFVLVPSEGMKESIQNKSRALQNKIKVFYPSQKFIGAPSSPPDSFKKIRETYSKVILMAGSIYAFPEICLIVEAVEELNELNVEQKIQLIFIGPEPGAEGFEKLNALSQGKSFIHILGRFSAAEVDACLALSDLNLLPYPFWHRELVEESFPSKFSKYLGSQSNMLVMAPEYSSLVNLLKRYDLREGLVTILSKTNISREIKKLIGEISYSESQKVKLRIIQTDLFSEEKYQETLLEVFSLNEIKFENPEIVRIALHAQKTWVNKVNIIVRNLSFTLENLRYPRYLLRRYILGSRITATGILIVKGIIGEAKYSKLRKELAKLLRKVMAAKYYFKYATSRPGKSKK